MFVICRRILLIGVAYVAIGCADDSDRTDLRVGLFFTENTRHLTMLYEPRHYPIMDPKDDVPVGKDIVSTLTKATRHVFASVETLDSYPTKESIADRQLNLVIVVHVGPAGGSLGYQGDSIQNSSEASKSLTAELTCLNPKMKEVAFNTVWGEGNATAKGILFDSRRRAFVGAVKSAIRNLGENAARQMNSNPEIRKLAE